MTGRDPPAPPPAPPLAGRRDLPRRQAALRFGLSAESRAAAFLLAKGYRILARRCKTPVGEIDIIARHRGVLVFVEVKARESLDAAAEAVTARQQARIIDAVQYWLAARSETVDSAIRFDVVLVAPGKIPRHLPGAFDATDRGG